jgi:hypothetical protein
MKKKCNVQVREEADRAGLYLWEVASLMNLSYSGFMQRMRSEWTPEEQQAVIKLIRERTKKEKL